MYNEHRRWCQDGLPGFKALNFFSRAAGSRSNSQQPLMCMFKCRPRITFRSKVFNSACECTVAQCDLHESLLLSSALVPQVCRSLNSLSTFDSFAGGGAASQGAENRAALFLPSPTIHITNNGGTWLQATQQSTLVPSEAALKSHDAPSSTAAGGEAALE